MSTVGSTLMACPNVQAELNNYFNSCSASTIGFRSPFGEFLLNPVNRKIQQIINPGAGKLKTVILRYDQAIVPSSPITSREDISCTASTKRGDLTASYSLDPDAVIGFEEKMEASDFYYACRSNPEIVMTKIALLMKAVREATYQSWADSFVNDALWGKWGGLVADSGYTVTSDELIVKTKKDSSIDPFPNTMQDINSAIALTSYCESPFIVGGNALYAYANLISNGGCCASNGINLGDIFAKYGYAVAYDKYLQSSSSLNSPNISASVQPGALQVVFFNEYETNLLTDAGGRIGANYDKFVINDPVSSMPMNVLLSDNCGVLSIFIHTCSKLVALPADMFAVGDDLEGVTFVNKIKVTNV